MGSASNYVHCDQTQIGISNLDFAVSLVATELFSEKYVGDLFSEKYVGVISKL